jgi:hypothetical protein
MRTLAQQRRIKKIDKLNRGLYELELTESNHLPSDGNLNFIISNTDELQLKKIKKQNHEKKDKKNK